MNYGLYLSAAGALTSLHRQDVYANNLANVNTVGFKPDIAITRDRLPARLEAGAPMADPQWMLEQLGGGNFVEPTRIDLKQGALQSTGNALDLAITGDGFFVVSTGKGTGPEQLRFTRDGRFTLNAQGELVMASTGMKVLDVNDQPIRLDPTLDVQIDSNGEISQNGEVVARLQVASPTDPSLLRKAGDNLLRFAEGASPTRTPALGQLHQGYVEGSAVDPILAMNAMISASKSLQSNATLMQYHDHIMGQAINTFGRVG